MPKAKDEGKVQASYYEKLKSEDVIYWALPLIEQGGYRLRFGDCHIIPDTSMHHNPPWHHTMMTDRFDCGMNMTIMHNIIFQRLPGGARRWIPSRCQGCWKVVVRPETLLQLFRIEEIQKRLERPGKCGIELRGFKPKPGLVNVHGRYGAYWYTPSVEEGRECWRAVQDALDADPVTEGIKAILKRACTEYEALYGDSSKWEVTPAQLHVEDIVHRKVESGTNFSPQAEHVITRVHVDWIEFACAVGDETYLLFTGGKPIHPTYRTYHDEEPEKPKPKRKTKKKKSAPRVAGRTPKPAGLKKPKPPPRPPAKKK
jgi:hypothetical protein